MDNFAKFNAAVALLVVFQATANAAVLVVTEPYIEAPGGFLDVLDKAKAGDTITFDPSFNSYTVDHNEAIKIDKPIKIDASSLKYGLSFRQLFSSFFNPGYFLIDTSGVTDAVKITNATFDGLLFGAPLRVNNSNFICQSCTIYGNRGQSFNSESAAAIVSVESNIALLSSNFIGNAGTQGSLYSGSGDLYLVNTFVAENYMSYLFSSAVIDGLGEDQLFYVRNSTFVGNFGRVFKMDIGSGSKLNIRHSIIMENDSLDLGMDQIEANIASQGFNILSGISDNSKYESDASDTVNADVFDVIQDQDMDGILSSNDFLSGPSPLLILYYGLNTAGIAFNQGDPLFSPYEVLLDYRRIPSPFLIPIFNSLRGGDQLGGIQTRVSGGRIDIGAYEMPVLQSN